MVMTSTHTLTKTNTQESFISECNVWQLKITRKKILKSLNDTHSLYTKSVMSQTFSLQLMSEVQNGSVALLMVNYSLQGKILWIVYHPSVRKYSGCLPIPLSNNSVGTPPPYAPTHPHIMHCFDKICVSADDMYKIRSKNEAYNNRPALTGQKLWQFMFSRTPMCKGKVTGIKWSRFSKFSETAQNNNNKKNYNNNSKLYPKVMRALAIGGEEDFWDGRYTQWVDGGQERRWVIVYVSVVVKGAASP